jgi:hypothetical protein
MDCDKEEPAADRGFEEEFETVPEGTDHVLLELPELHAGGDDTHTCASGEENVPLHSKDTGEPANMSSDIRVAELESRQSIGSDSLLDLINIRKESEIDAINTESLDNKYNESEGMELETNRSTEESHNVKKTVTNGNAISGKEKSKEYDELNIKEREEHEAHDRQKKEIKEVSDKEGKELEENHDKEKGEIYEVSNNKKRDIKELRDKEKNDIKDVTDNKTKETEKVCDSEHNETELNDKEKKEVEEQSDKEKEKVELGDNGEKTHVAVNKPENSEDKGMHESQAVELLDIESKETAENTSESGKTVSTTKGSLVRAGSEECEMDVDDTNPYPDHINFVDVNAPNCDSPMVIDDDNDDEIVMIERRKGTSHRGTSANKENGKTDNSNRDSSPEVVVQEELCKRRQEIVIDLEDDDDIEIETIKKKKKKKKKSNAPKGVCCCNIECSTPGQDLRSAPVFVLTYYGRKYKKGKAEKVCTVCFEAAMQHNEVSVCAHTLYGVVYFYYNWIFISIII